MPRMFLYYATPEPPHVPNTSEFLEHIVKDLATNSLQFQQETRTNIQNLNTQVG